MSPKTRWMVAGLAAGVAAVVAGGLSAGAAISAGSDDEELTGATRDRAVSAALEATGGGTVTDTERGDDGAAYEVEVLLADGRQVEVNLDRDLNVIGHEADDDSVDGNEVDDD